MAGRLTGFTWPLAALPSPLGYAWASVEVSHYEGWGQWAAAPLLLVPLGYGALLALGAATAAWCARRAGRPNRLAWLAVMIALLPWLHVLARNLGR